MKKRILSVICFMLLICMTFTFVACDNGKDPVDTNPPHTHNFVEGKCSCGESDPNYVAPHVHTFVEGQCECGEKDPNYVPPVDYTKDIPNAVDMINKVFKGEVNVTKPENMNFNAHVGNLTVEGTLKDDFDVSDMPIDNIAMKDNVMYIKLVEMEDGPSDVYIVFADAGMYMIATDGTRYEYNFSPYEDVMSEFVPDDDTTDAPSMPEITADDIVYDAVSGYFIVTDAYMSKLMDAMTPDVPEVDVPSSDVMVPNEMAGIASIFENLSYSVRFKINEKNELAELNIKGVSTQDNINTDVLAYVITQDDGDFSMSLTMNVMVMMNVKIEGKMETENKYVFSASMNVTPPMGMGEAENVIIKMEMDVSENALVISDEIKALMTKCDKIMANYDKIVEKYDNTDFTLTGSNCETIQIYDSEYGVYVTFDNYGWDTPELHFDGIDLESNNDNCCEATLNGTTITVTKHCQMEIIAQVVEMRYAGEFTATHPCEYIVIYDSELKVYVFFQEDWFNDDKYVYYDFDDELYGDECVAIVNLDSKTLTITEHSAQELALSAVKNVEFTPIGTYDPESEVSVYFDAMDKYLLFVDYGNGKLVYCGHTSFPMGGQTGILNLTAKTITIQ